MKKIFCTAAIILMMILYVTTAQAAAKYEGPGIRNNGAYEGIYIDIYSNAYTSIAGNANHAYKSNGCTWFVSGRVKELTGKKCEINGSDYWYTTQGPANGFTSTKTLPTTTKSIICLGPNAKGSTHVAIIEHVYSDGSIIVSEGGAWECADYDWCDIKYYESIDKYRSYNKLGSLIGYVNLGVPLDTCSTPSWDELRYFAVTKEDYADVRSGYYKTEKSIYEAPRGSYYKILDSFTNEHKNLWYKIQLPGGSTGWIFSENGKTCTPRTETIKNYNCDYYVPVHTDYYGKASNVFTVDGRANDSTTVYVYAEVKNSYGNTWYLVKHSKGMGWLWSNYCSDNYSMVCAVSYKSFRVIDDPEAGVLGVSMGTTVFDAEGASSFTISPDFTAIDGFRNASALKTITIPTSVTSIGANAFSSCSALTTVNYAGTTAQWNAISISSSGNSNLSKAKIVCQANAASAAAFTSVSAAPTTTSAMLRATVAVTSGSGTFTKSGIRVYNSAGTVIASKDETHSYYRSASGTSSYNIWYDVAGELGKTLSAGTAYSYQFYTVFNGQTIWSGKKSFTTSGQTMNFEFSVSELSETYCTYNAKGTASKKGKFTEFGYTYTDLTTGAVAENYSNTTDKNLNVSGAQFFSLNNWILYGKPGHTYSMQLYFIFNGTKYYSSVYTITFPDKTKPVISSARTFDCSANGFSASCTVTDNNAVKSVQFAVWTTGGGQDDLVYHDAVQSGSSWTCSVNAGDGHNGEVNCTYSVQIIATDMNGNQSKATLSQYIDAVPPVISDVTATPLYNGKYKVSCTVTDDQEVYNVKGVSNFVSGTKTTNSTASASGSTYSFTVNCANLSSAAGYFTTRISAYDSFDNLTAQTLSIYIDPSAPIISDVRATNITRSGFDISCLIEEEGSGIASVLFPSWTSACADGSGNAQDDLDADWETSGKYAGTLDENGRWTYHVSFADHNSETGLYNTSIIVRDGFGNSSSFLTVTEIRGSDEASSSSYARASGEFGGHTYVVYEYTASGSAAPILDWDEAQSFCRSLGGHLVAITSEEENAFVSGLLSDADLYKTGLFYTKQAWIGAYGSGSGVSGAGVGWVTGEPFSYTDWSSPAYGYVPSGSAVAMTPDGWKALSKGTSAAFICEFEPLDLSGMTTLVLPGSLDEIQSEAFAGVSAQVVILPEACRSIASRAFANCPDLEYVVVPSLDSVDIADDAFAGSYVTIIEE